MAQGSHGTDTGYLTVKPLTPYSELNLTSASLSVEEVGFYSLNGDLECYKELVPVADRKALRLMQLKCTPERQLSVSINLDDPAEFKEESVKHIRFHQEIPTMLKWAYAQREDPKLQEIQESIQLISTRGILSDLMNIPYNKEPREATGSIFGAAKVKGKIIMGHVERENLNGIFLERPNSHSTPITLKDKMKACRGRQFETCMTKKKDGSDDASGAPRFRSVMLLRLKELVVLVGTGIDGADPLSKEDYPKKYVDFAILPSWYMEGRNAGKLYGDRGFRWWTNNVLLGIQNIHVGVHNDGLVTSIKTFRTNDIPSAVQEQERKSRRPLWNDKVCLGFLYKLLHFVLEQVVQDHTESVYEFTCPSDRDAVFTCRKIPTELAKGHSYILEDSEQFPF